MKSEALVASWRKTRDSSRVLMFALVFSGLANLVLGFGVINQKSVVTLVPPQMNAETAVGFDFADSSYIEAWALFTSQALGNVTPSSVKFVRSAVEPILSPVVYQNVMNTLERQIETIKDNHVVLFFEPRRILREAATGKIFIHGQSVLESPTGEKTRTERTYEFKFETVNYMPSLTHVDTYRGPPKTVEEIAQAEKIAAKQREREAKAANK